jgi:hypothetical protein
MKKFIIRHLYAFFLGAGLTWFWGIDYTQWKFWVFSVILIILIEFRDSVDD